MGKLRGNQLYYLGELNFHIKNYEKSIDYFEEYIQLSEINNFELNYYLGFSYYFNKKYSKAIPYLEAYSTQPNYYELFYFIGYCCYQIKDHKKASDNLKLYLEKDSEKVHKKSSLFFLGKIYFELKLFNNSIQEFKAIIPLLKDELEKSRINYYLGLNYFKLDKLDDCKKYVDKAIKINNNLDNNWLLAQCERKMNHHEIAIKYYLYWANLVEEKFTKNDFKKFKKESKIILDYISNHSNKINIPHWIKKLNDQ